MVGSNSIARSIADFAFQMSRNNRLKFMNNVTEALAFLRQKIEADRPIPTQGDQHG